MFSGIVETTGTVLAVEGTAPLYRISVQRPPSFDDLATGDSISCDGVCLTLEAFDDTQMRFALAAETLQVTGWTDRTLLAREFNLERSLRLQDRIHGHIVSGHVDGMGLVTVVQDSKEVRLLQVQVPVSVKKYVWKKGSIALNGVSLTVNEISSDGIVSVCLVPETLKRTNLKSVVRGTSITVEVDPNARGLIQFLETAKESL